MGRAAASDDDLQLATRAASKRSFVFVDADDWEGLYENGVLLAQDHHVGPRPQDLLDILAVPFTRTSWEDESDLEEYIYQQGRLPERISDLPLELPAEGVVLVDAADDWEGIYLDGSLRYENHSLRARDILETLGFDFEYTEANSTWLWHRGELPETLKAVVYAGDTEVKPGVFFVGDAVFAVDEAAAERYGVSADLVYGVLAMHDDGSFDLGRQRQLVMTVPADGRDSFYQRV